MISIVKTFYAPKLKKRRNNIQQFSEPLQNIDNEWKNRRNPTTGSKKRRKMHFRKVLQTCRNSWYSDKRLPSLDESLLDSFIVDDSCVYLGT